ncbi:MAG: cobalamin biosynthesis protein CbiM [Chloroflexi bacterium]|nr:cobalamin biosynthesis protein CbiM [Chloroflexota bacterium]
MHIPDGFMSPAVSIILWIAAIAGVGYALWRVNRELDERKMPLMGVLAAAIFAGQMLNFAVTGGTSGHLMGAALATILLGPWASIVVMTAVVSIQALLFQDGGLLALGANLVNMALVGSFVSYAVYRIMQRLVGTRRWGALVSGFVAAWLSIVAAALFVGLQLALSGTSPASLALPAMGGIHLLIGLGEGLITVGALALIAATRPDLLGATGGARGGSNRGVVLAGLAIALLLAVISPIASGNPDGLEWVAEQLNFLDAAQDPAYNLVPDYVFPGVANEKAATIAAGVLGVLIVFGVALFSGRLGRRKDAVG